MPGAAEDILRTLEAHALDWDEAPLWQSLRTEAYEAALSVLRHRGRVYACDCSRKELSGPYPGSCRARRDVPAPHALRLRLDDDPIEFVDRWQGPQRFEPRAIGDPVIRRRDGLFAYQLAVVVDDAWQGVTDVVRGADLLDSTPWQIAICRALELPLPTYAHAPLITEANGEKLSKSQHAVPVAGRLAGANLCGALRLLGQSPPPDLHGAPAREVVAWARAHWRPGVLENRTRIALRESDLGWEGPM